MSVGLLRGCFDHREASAQFNLHRQGYRSFTPRVRRTIRHARTMRSVIVPLFPGYIFVILDLSLGPWRCVNSTIGVASLIMGVEQPIPVPPGVVEALVAANRKLWNRPPRWRSRDRSEAPHSIWTIC